MDEGFRVGDVYFDNRDFSDELIEEAIALVFDRYAGNFAGSDIRATAEDYRRGALWTVSIPMLSEPLDVAIRIATSSIAR